MVCTPGMPGVGEDDRFRPFRQILHNSDVPRTTRSDATVLFPAGDFVSDERESDLDVRGRRQPEASGEPDVPLPGA